MKKAIIWLRETGKEVRNARLAPFAGKSARVWDMLRQESNVDLGPIRLEGSATQRRVSLDLTVDGLPGAALGVMSQGELHALGLALFLPRATAPGSPFRFLIIDDPVQCVDRQMHRQRGPGRLATAQGGLELGPVVTLAAFCLDKLRGNDFAGPALDKCPNCLTLGFQS